MAAPDIPIWKNIDPSNASFEELSIIIQQILDYLADIDARLTTGGL